MRKLCKALALTICAAMLISPLTAAGDSSGKTILTLEEAKEMAIKNDTSYKAQDRYIEQKKEDYQDAVDKYSGNVALKGSSIVEKTEQYINYRLMIDNAYNAWQLEIFKKGDLKRQSDYNVTIAYYDVMKDKYSLDDAQRAMDLAKKNLDIAKIQNEYGMITKNALSQYENAYKSAQTAYNSALSELENSMAALGKEIGKELDINNYDIDMTIGMPDTKSIDLEKIKEDQLKNKADFYSLKSSLSTAEYQKLLVEERYDYYDEKTARMSETIEDGFNELRYEADRDYEDVKYQYDEAVKALDIALKQQLAGINTLEESIANLRKSVENARTTYTQNKTKYDLGLISKIELEKSESDLKDLQNQLYTSIVNLNAQYLALTQYSYTREK